MDSYHGLQLWVSNGTEVGTFVAMNFGRTDNPGETNNPTINLYPVDKNVFFFHGRELWISDGTIEGTNFISVFNQLSSFLEGSQLNNLFVFSISTSSGNELWRSDGTVQGTFRLSAPIPGFVVPKPVVFGNNLFFVARDGTTGFELWKTDGTTSGTQLVKNIMPGSGSSNPKELKVSGQFLFFTAEDNISGRELWKTDGTADGTKNVYDFNNGLTSGSIRQLVNFKEKLFFVYENIERELWCTDGATTKKVIDLTSYSDRFTSTSSTLFFAKNEFGTTGNELWATDGTAEGTRLVKDIFPGIDNGISNQSELIVFNDKIQFLTYRNAISELWTSDGTPQGTNVIASTQELSGAIGEMYNLIATTRGMFFTYNNSGNDQNLWISNGLISGAFKVKEFEAAPHDSSVSEAPLLFKGSYYFNATDGINGFEIWRTNADDITERFSRGSLINSSADLLFFSSSDDIHGLELWSTDGTINNTTLIKDISPGEQGTEFGPTSYVVSDKLFFTSKHPIYGRELWTSDGTESGTVNVKDIYPGIPSSEPGIIGSIEAKIIFKANDGVHGEELWVTDGTEVGTQLIADIAPGASSSDIRYWSVVDGIIYFAADNGFNGFELWRSDGTSVGTYLLKDIANGSASGNPFGFTKFNNLIYFSAYDEIQGWAIWRTDGTSLGTESYYDAIPGYQFYGGTSGFETLESKLLFWTTLVSNFVPYQLELGSLDGVNAPTKLKTFPYFNTYSEPIVFKNTLYFQATDPAYGSEIWKTDGTATGTELLRDINPGTRGIIIDRFLIFDDFFYFRCTFSRENRHLWKSDGTSCRTQQMTSDPIFINHIWPIDNNRFFVVGDHKQFGSELFVYNRLIEPALRCRQVQQITFGPLQDKKYGDLPFGLNAISDSGLPINFKLSNPNVVAVDNGESTILKTGKVIITAEQAGNEFFEPALEIKQLLTVVKGKTNIGFPDIMNRKYGDPPYVLKATSESMEPIIFTSSNTSIASIENNILTIIKPGTAVITATQQSNEFYEQSDPVLRPLTITKASQTITFNLQDQLFDKSGIALSGTSSSSLPLIYISKDSKIKLTNNEVEFLEPGRVEITALQSGNEYFEMASSASSFCINPTTPIIKLDTTIPTEIVLESNSLIGNYWFYNNAKLENSEPRIIATETGDYALQIIIDDCKSDLSSSISIAVTSILDDSQAFLYPNPVNKYLFLNTRVTGVYEVFDITGKMTLSGALILQDNIDLSILSPNLYFLRLTLQDQIFIKKILKQ